MKVALLGLGTVNKAVYDIIENKKGLLFAQKEIVIKYVLVRNLVRKGVRGDILTNCFKTIVNDPEIEIVFEAMGSPLSYKYIKESLEKGKSVITANKEVIAENLGELIEIATKNKVKLLYEASVGGGIPIINTMKNASVINNIYSITGILNGTSNYILTKMQTEKLSLNTALSLAQKAGFAESNPTSDLTGLDMIRKIAILSSIAYHGYINISDVYSYGITSIDKSTIEIADILGYKVKFMAVSRLINNEVYIIVEPALIVKTSLMANVDYEYNVIEYIGDNSFRQTMTGKGAGVATANAMINDLYLYFNKEEDIIPLRALKVNNYIAPKWNYFIKLNDKIDKKYIYQDLKGYIITKPISRQELESILPKAQFYARIHEEE